MSRHHVDSVAFDPAAKGDLGPPIDGPLAESLDHRPGIRNVAGRAGSRLGHL